jgi:hypothetical protein
MIILAIGNVALLIVATLIYFKYSKLNSSLSNEIKTLNDRIIAEKIDAEDHLLLETKLSSDKIEELLREIDELRKEKEQEVRARLEAEKQVALSTQKIHEIEKRIQDWSATQEAAIKDSTRAIMQIGDDIYKKLNRSHQFEIETNKNLISKFSQNISELFRRSLEDKKSSELLHRKDRGNFDKSVLREFIIHSVDSFKSLELKINHDFFVASNLDPEKSKSFLCEIALIGRNKLNLIDLKACSYFAEYYRASKKIVSADELLKQKLDKYFSYLSNQKYRDLTLSSLPASKAKFDDVNIIIALETDSDVELLKAIHYYGKARKLDISVISFEEITKLT